MRLMLLLLFSAVALSACGSDETVVVAPPGASVVCPNGHAATLKDGRYSC